MDSVEEKLESITKVSHLSASRTTVTLSPMRVSVFAFVDGRAACRVRGEHVGLRRPTPCLTTRFLVCETETTIIAAVTASRTSKEKTRVTVLGACKALGGFQGGRGEAWRLRGAAWPPGSFNAHSGRTGVPRALRLPEAPRTICPVPRGRAPLSCVLAPH